MKKESSIKKIFICTGYLLLTLICIVGIYILISMSSKKDNDSIVQACDNGNCFRNVSSKFLVDFVNNEYIRFETISSYSNPFEEEERGIWENIKYSLGIKKESKGIEISLIDASYDTTMQERLDLDSEQDGKIFNRGFELTTLGREIGNDEESVSKDTVISKDILKGIDIEYQIINGKGLKEEIVLKDIPEYTQECDIGECVVPLNRFVFNIKLDEGLRIKRSIDGTQGYPTGTFYIVDSEGNYYAHFLPEYAVDGVGYKTSNVISSITEADSGEYTYEIILDPEWLLSEERVFPVKIDPSIIHDSELTFDQGIYDRVQQDINLTIGLNSLEQKSGTYTSSILELGESAILKSISWQGYAQATGDGELPFSTLGLIYEENFNTSLSNRIKWGTGSLQLNSGESKILNINSNVAENITLEFWSYRRNMLNSNTIFSSNLGNLKIESSRYIFEDTTGAIFETNIPVNYNDWQYISLIFNISSMSVTIYIDELEYISEIGYMEENSLESIKYEGVGYIDTARVYERLLAKNELLSNSQYSNIQVQYMSSTDAVSWGDWINKISETPTTIVNEKSIDISTSIKSVNEYDMLSLEFLSDEELPIVLGENPFQNGVDQEDITRVSELEGSIESTQGFKYLDLFFSPNINQSSCVLDMGDLKITTSEDGLISVVFNGQEITSDDMYTVGEKNHLAMSFLTDRVVLYLNSNTKEFNSPYTLIPTTYSLGKGCSESLNPFDGDITDVRLSSIEKDTNDIEKYSNIEKRAYLLRPVFKASLQNDTQIQNLEDIQFSISQMPFGELNHIVTLNIGDTVAISEGQYSLEGVVTFVEHDTGLVEVKEWKEGGSVPPEGFTTSAKVLKWQREYISTDIFTSESSLISNMNIKYEYPERVKDIKLISGFNTQDQIEDTNERYIRYMLIFTTDIYGVSPYISSVNIDYLEGGPSMDEVMRHGQWFNDGAKQPFWWSK